LNDTDKVLDQVVELVAANTKKMGALGARALVLGKFFEAALPSLTTSQRVEITRSFRQGIEDALAMTDDVALPAEYHSALLELTNAILTALGQQPPRRQ
jgi:hypothetical protein